MKICTTGPRGQAVSCSLLVLIAKLLIVISPALVAARERFFDVDSLVGVRVEEPSLSLVPDGRIAINAAATRLLVRAGIKNVLLLWDKAAHKVALKAAPKGDKNSYRVSVAPDLHSGSIRAKAFLAHIGWSRHQRVLFSAIWHDKEGMLEITISDDEVGAHGGRRSTKGDG